MDSRLRTTTALAVAFVVPLSIYAATARPGIDFWDTGDLQTVPYLPGIAYPTGYPGYVLLGWVWSHAFAAGEVAWRMNVFNGVAVAAGCAAIVAGAVALGTAPEIAAVAALIAAFAHPVWQIADHADAHGVGAAAVALALAAALTWWRSASARALDACGAVAGAALAIDAATLLPLAGVALVALARRPPPRRLARTVLVAAAIVVAAYAYLPLRSAAVSAAHTDPTLALGLAAGAPFWDDHHPATWTGFVTLVSGSEFAVGGALTSLFAPATFARAGRLWYPRVRRDFAFGSFALALAGFGVALRRAPLVALGLAAVPALPVLFVLAYREEAQIERYYAVGDLVIALLLAYGADRLLRIVDEAPRRFAALLAVLLLCGVAVHEVRDSADLVAQHGDRSARVWIERVIATVPARAVVVSPWAYATPLGYAAYVERTLGERIVVTAWPADLAARIAVWRRTRPVVVVLPGSDPPPPFPGSHLRRLDDGDPRLYEVIP